MEHSSASAALLERVLAGDQAAIDGLIGAGWPRIGRATPDAIDRAELRQEAAGVLIEAAHAFKAAPTGDFAAYAAGRIQTRLRTLLRAERRRGWRTRPLDGIEDERLSVELETRFAQQVESPALAGALRKLSPRLRGLIARIYWEGLTPSEVAARDGVAPEVVRQARRRAEAALRRHMQGRR